MEICPHHLLLDLDDLVRLGPYGMLRPRASPAGAGRAAVGLRAGRHRRLPDLRPLRLHDRGEGARLAGHLRRAAGLPGDPGDGAAGAGRGLPPARHAAGRVRALLVHQPGPDRAAVSAQGHACCPARTPTSPSTTWSTSGRWMPAASSSRRTRGRRSTAARARARVVRTLVRGETVYADGEILAAPGSGRFLSSQDDYSLAAPPHRGGRLTLFRLALINPNTDPHHTDGDGRRGAGRAAGGLRGDRRQRPSAAPARSRGRPTRWSAAAEMAALVRSLPEHDAYLIACFGDPGLDAARELATAPVVGIGEAAYTAATLVGKRFARDHHAAAQHPGAGGGDRGARRAAAAAPAVLPLHIPVAEQGAGHPDTTEAIVAAGQRAGRRARRRRPDPGLRRHGRRRRARSSSGWACRSATASPSAPCSRYCAVELRASHQQGRRLRGARADPLLWACPG